jgi:hypothetical protein
MGGYRILRPASKSWKRKSAVEDAPNVTATKSSRAY